MVLFVQVAPGPHHRNHHEATGSGCLEASSYTCNCQCPARAYKANFEVGLGSVKQLEGSSMGGAHKYSKFGCMHWQLFLRGSPEALHSLLQAPLLSGITLHAVHDAARHAGLCIRGNLRNLAHQRQGTVDIMMGTAVTTAVCNGNAWKKFNVGVHLCGRPLGMR
jgi:hypothetical protein